jgi:MYXO-CTERM domain-containing protein
LALDPSAGFNRETVMKINSKHGRLVLAAAGLALLPTPAMAQEVEADTVTVNNVVEADVPEDRVEREDDKDFPWGLLGLLGLAGLLGRKKRDDDRDIRVDARRDTRT